MPSDSEQLDDNDHQHFVVVSTTAVRCSGSVGLVVLINVVDCRAWLLLLTAGPIVR